MTETRHATMARRMDVPSQRADDVYVFPASFAQQRLWFLDQWEPDSAAYNVPAAFRLSGPLDIAAFERSLTAIALRHEALRTTFGIEDGEPVQIVEPEQPISLRTVDLTALPVTTREAEAQRLATTEIHRPFDLSTGPLLRALHLRLADRDHVVVFTIHHIVFDGWSTGVLLRELAAHYNGFTSGTPVTLPPLPIQYPDYTIAQRDWLRGEALERQLAYWREQLRGPLPVLELPADRPPPPLQSSRGAQLHVRWPRSVLDEVAAVSRRERVTLFMTLLAGFQTLLCRYTEQEDISVGTAIAGRHQVALEHLIGFFVNTLVLRTDLSGNPTFTELLARVRGVALDAYAHQDVPFEKLVAELHPERSLSHTPLCQAMFVFQNTPRHALDLNDLTVAPFEILHQNTKFDISVSLREEPDGLDAVFTYSTDRFERSTIERMAAHYETLLRSIGRHPEQRLSELSFLPARERRQLLVEWNDTATPYPRDETVHGLFEREVARAPAATAIVCGSQRLTYAELDRRANQLAHALRSKGVRPGALVAVCIGRSADLIVALVGILKAGAAYVPLDAADPPDRLRDVLEDAGVRLVVTDTKGAPRVPPIDGVQRLDLSDNQPLLDRQSADASTRSGTAESLAYMMYTSGSTGAPKGVAIVHRGIVRLVRNTSYLAIRADDVVLHAAPVTFDASTLEIWGALLNGATLALVPEEKPSLAELGRTLTRDRVTVAWLTSGLFSQMVDHEIDQLRQVRHVLAGGDVLPVEQVRTFLGAGGSASLTNGYGPTENTTFTCCHRVTAGTSLGASVPIGRPISNTQVYVLDRHLNPQPIGVPGELYAAGDGLARGYWNRPDLTAGAFVPNPFSDEPGARMYKTGDRVRYLSDGTIEFLGRLDRQVKVNGYRVELEEIESALSALPGVSEAAVIALGDAAWDKRLIAYVATRQPVDVAALGCALDQRLPNYMVPRTFVALDELPKNTAGKIDRRRLPSHQPEPAAAPDPEGAPRNDVERTLVDLWRQILGRSRVGVHDNFFDLGGHSLLATQIISRIHLLFGKELPLRVIFETPTIAGVAARLMAGGVAGPATSASTSGPDVSSIVVPLQPRGTKTPFFCVHGIGGEVQVYAPLARHFDPDRPFFGLRMPPVTGDDDFPSIEEMAARYVTALRATVPSGPYIVGGYSSGATVAFEMARQLTAAGERVSLVAVLDSGLPNNRRAVGLNPRSLIAFTQNAFWWIADDLMQTGRGEFARRVRSKAILLASRVAAVPGLGWLPHGSPDIRDRLGIPDVPKEWSGFLARHFKSLMAYVPQTSPGRLAFFRARAWPLLRFHEPDAGWGRMAAGGVEITVVPGSHDSILREPYVRALAAALSRSFDAVDRAEHIERGRSSRVAPQARVSSLSYR